MTRLRDMSIPVKIIGLVVLTTVFTLGTGFAIFVPSHLTSMREAMVRSGVMHAKLIGSHAVDHLSGGQGQGPEHLLDYLRNFSNVLDAKVYDRHGVLVAAFARDLGYPQEPVEHEVELVKFHEGALHIHQPIEHQGTYLGTIGLRLCAQGLEQRSGDYLWYALGTLLALVSLSLLLAMWFHRVVTRPLLTLAEVAQHIAREDDYTIRVPESGRDEIGVLCDHFNHMLEQIQSRQDERNRANRALRNSEGKFHALAGLLPLPVFEVDPQGCFTFVNRTALTALGYEEADIAGGLTLSDLIDRQERWQLDARLKKMLHGEMRAREEYTIVRKDGTTFSAILSSSSILQEKQVVGIRGVIVDISDRKRAEQMFREMNEELEDRVERRTSELNDTLRKLQESQSQLVQAQKLEAIGQLAAGIAHEINTPAQFVGDNTRFVTECFDDLMAVLSAQGDLVKSCEDQGLMAEAIGKIKELEEEKDLDFIREEAPAALEQSLEGLGRIAHIVLAMREFSHPGERHKTPSSINKTIETTVTVSRNEWKYVAEIDLDLAENLSPVECHPNEIGQIWLNLIVNASHAIGDVVEGTEDKGRIGIRTYGDDDQVTIEVSDTGAGIPEDIRNRIYEPFFTTKEVGTGSGQGLAFVYDIVVNKHGGTIECDTGEGKGTTFLIRLPVRQQDLKAS